MKILIPLIALNILIIPALVFFHFQGECKVLQQYLGQSIVPFCGYVNNVFLNILYVNGLIIFLALFMTAHKMTNVTKDSTKSAPKPSRASH